ncbi:CDP-glycerol glycerophosphotransferase family protein [Paenibacillus sp. GXUN7292]|uniref:CDP-glycerol glycerophosphotransferase family protein n=1 Tax=Paenibacillus sp. GXUN7292 TaxID=3422499 RepID=UPI003D7EEE6B
MKNLMASFKKRFILTIIHILNVLPIKNNKIFLFSYYGSQYGDNPKYISEYIVANFPDNKFDIVWAFNDLESKRNLTGIKKVKVMSFTYFYHLCTAKVIITNYRTTEMFIKRKKQYYIQTWHSSLRLKHIEKDAEHSLPEHYVQMAKQDSLKCDLLLSGCKLSTEIFQRSFWYDGEILEIGTPRNDILFHKNPAMREQVLSALHLPIDHNIVLYAPTFRKNNNLDVYDINYSQLLASLKNKFGGEWIVLVRLHPHLLSKAKELPFSNDVINVTSYDDIQQLLSVADVLISDYSSLMFDYSFTQRPCFLYVPDVEEYSSTERKLYFELWELPYISAFSNNDLLNKVENFDREEYERNLKQFLARIGTFEEGKACESLIKRIDEVCFENERRQMNEAV